MPLLKSPFHKSVYEQNAQVYKLLANPKRLEILNTIKTHEATVKDIADALQVRMSNVSQHLAILLHLGIVHARRNGKNVFYRIVDPRIIAPCKILKDLREIHKLTSY